MASISPLGFDPDDREVSSPDADDTLSGLATPRQIAGKCRRGDSIGPYIVIDAVGSGASGRVYAAYDRRLERKVALKILHERWGHGSHDERDRVLGEAQALAKVSHPNVVAVHEAAEAEGRFYIAMEYVEGHTLSEWLRVGPRSLSEKLEVLVAAGMGLAAAHRGGLVHRDVKPSNIMIGVDGRVRMMDFGLARFRGPDTQSHDSDGHAASGSMATTQQTGIAGTPAYMAPEQHRGRSPDPRADQFSFCVTAYETIVGTKPFAGDSLPEVVAATLEGRVVEPSRSACPGWLWAVLKRGLSSRPEDRFASMSVLIERLHRSPWRGRKAGAVMVGLVSGLSALAGAMAAGSPPPSCDEDELDAVWTPTVRREVAERFAWAESTVGRVDDYVEAWKAARSSSCRGDTGLPMLESLLANDCLDLRARELSFSVELLQRPEPIDLRRAVNVIDSLTPIERCQEPTYLRSGASVDAAEHVGPMVREVELQLVQVEVLRRAGAYADGLALASEAFERATAIGHDRLTAEAHLMRAWSLLLNGKPQLGLRDSELAFDMALRTHADLTAARAGSLTLIGLGLTAQDDAAIDVWRRHTMALVHRIGRRDLEIEALNASAVVDLEKHRPARAIPILQRAKAMLDQQGERGTLRASSVTTNLATALHGSGRSTEAEPLYREEHAEMARRFGPAHPDTLITRLGIATTLHDQRRFEPALDEVRATCAGLSGSLDAMHPKVLHCRSIEAEFELAAGHFDRAEQLGDEIASLARAASTVQPWLRAAAASLRAMLCAGRIDEAIAGYQRLLAELEGRADVDPRYLAFVYDAAARAFHADGQRSRASAAAAKSLQLFEGLEPWSATDVGGSHALLGRIALAGGDRVEARRRLETAIAMMTFAHAIPTAPAWLAEAELAYGELELGRASTDAVALRRSLSMLAESGGAFAPDVAHFSRVLGLDPVD